MPSRNMEIIDHSPFTIHPRSGMSRRPLRKPRSHLHFVQTERPQPKPPAVHRLSPKKPNPARKQTPSYSPALLHPSEILSPEQCANHTQSDHTSNRKRTSPTSHRPPAPD